MQADDNHDKQTVDNAMQEGNVPLLKPKLWGSTKASGNDKEHPAPVISRDGNAVTVLQLTHKPIRGQRPIPTERVAPSVDTGPNEKGYPSVVDLKARRIELEKIRKEQGDSITVISQLPRHELENLKVAAKSASCKSNAGKRAAVAAGQNRGRLEGRSTWLLRKEGMQD